MFSFCLEVDKMKLEVGKKYKPESKSSGVYEITSLRNGLNLYGNALKPLFTGKLGKLSSEFLFFENGKSLMAGIPDLIEEYTEPKKLSGWINVYENITESFDTKEDADGLTKKDRLACLDLSQFNVGEGL